MLPYWSDPTRDQLSSVAVHVCYNQIVHRCDISFLEVNLDFKTVKKWHSSKVVPKAWRILEEGVIP